jgi:hypothetical protein
MSAAGIQDVSGDHQCALHGLTLGPIIWDAPLQREVLRVNGSPAALVRQQQSGAHRRIRRPKKDEMWYDCTSDISVLLVGPIDFYHFFIPDEGSR